MKPTPTIPILSIAKPLSENTFGMHPCKKMMVWGLVWSR
jgi:hypothetical protein